MKPSKKIKTLITCIPLLGMTYCTYLYATAEQRMRQTCSEIHPQMSVEDLRRFARLHGLTEPHTHAGTAFLAEKKTFGRSACQVELQKGVVQRVLYSFAN